jgi:hypothetical protein
VVARAVEFQLTTARGWKLLPVRTRVKADEPAGTVDGETFATIGDGAREGAAPPEPPEQPVRRLSTAKVLKRRRQRKAQRQAGSEVCRVVIKDP